jgi:hypothetical protein
MANPSTSSGLPERRRICTIRRRHSSATTIAQSTVLTSDRPVATCNAEQIEMGKPLLTESGTHRSLVCDELRLSTVPELRQAISRQYSPFDACRTHSRSQGTLVMASTPSKASSGGARMGWWRRLALSRFSPFSSQFCPRRGQWRRDGERGFGAPGTRYLSPRRPSQAHAVSPSRSTAEVPPCSAR